MNPVEYLADVLIRVQTHPASRIDELLPHTEAADIRAVGLIAGPAAQVTVCEARRHGYAAAA